MKPKKLLSSAAVAAAFALASIPSAHAGGGGFVGAMEATQWLNNAELVNVYSSNLEQLQQQIQMYQNMYQNTLGIPIQAWSSIAARLTSLVSTIQNTQGIVNATVNSITDMQTTYGNGNLLSNQQQNLVNWNKGLNNQIGAALQQLGLNANNFSTTQSALQQIQLASQTAAGRLQAIQAGNQIADAGRHFSAAVRHHAMGECRWHDGHAGESGSRRIRRLDGDCFGLRHQFVLRLGCP